jgi:hemoglobin-like flavoprotein
VRGLDRLDGLIPALEALGRRHTIYGVRDEHYATVGDALLWTLEQRLGDDCTPAVREAWAIAYGTLTEMMQAATPQAVA